LTQVIGVSGINLGEGSQDRAHLPRRPQERANRFWGDPGFLIQLPALRIVMVLLTLQNRIPGSVRARLHRFEGQFYCLMDPAVYLGLAGNSETREVRGSNPLSTPSQGPVGQLVDGIGKTSEPRLSKEPSRIANHTPAGATVLSRGEGETPPIPPAGRDDHRGDFFGKAFEVLLGDGEEDRGLPILAPGWGRG
jgi:hypothetical protein